MKEIKQENSQDGLYKLPFTLKCSRCGHVWKGENEAAVNALIESGTDPCDCVKYLDNLSQEDLQKEIQGVLDYDAVIDVPKPPEANQGPAPLKVVDW